MVQPENTRPAFTYTAMSLIYRHVYRVVVVVIVVVMSSRPLTFTKGQKQRNSNGYDYECQPFWPHIDKAKMRFRDVHTYLETNIPIFT